MKISKFQGIAIYLGLLLFLSNIPPLQSILKFIFDQNFYYFSTSDGSWLIDGAPYKNRIFEYRKVTTNEFRERYPEADTIIYRNFKPNPIAFWRYRDYIFDERYTLPYLPLDEARKKRQEWKERMKKEGRPY